MWSIFNQAKQWAVRPSALVNITDDYKAYCFDEAICYWGMYVTNELEKIEGKNEKEVSRKRHNRLLKLIKAPDSMRFKPLRPQPK
jgi:hypothetical protein